MSLDILDCLDQWKSRFEPEHAGQLEALLRSIAALRLAEAADLIRLHETLLFLRAYPLTPAVARLADRILFGFADRVAGADPAAFQEPEVSGIAGTSLTAVFSYEVARGLVERHPRNVEIAWDGDGETANLGPALSNILPLVAEDWPVEAHVPFRQWIAAARPGGMSDLAWLLQRVDGAAYDAMQLPIAWDIGTGPTSRSRLRLPGRKLFYHPEPLLRRADVSLEAELAAPLLPVRRLARAESRKILDLILDTSSMRYRELYGFSHPDHSAVFHTDAGRGVDIYFFGVPPERRLPLRAYHAGVFFKNGVPAGYVELLSLFERAEVGFNVYYTFREGESAWLYARLLRLFHQVLGVSCFTVDPYQIGLENAEAVDSGAFWFYRKLGFRPVAPEAARLVEREELRMRRTPGYRSSKRTLERLARTYLIYEGPAARNGEWDGFTIRNLGLAVQRAMSRGSATGILEAIPGFSRWGSPEQAAAVEVFAAKKSAQETRYLRLMQRHPRLRAALLALGSQPPKDGGAGDPPASGRAANPGCSRL